MSPDALTGAAMTGAAMTGAAMTGAAVTGAAVTGVAPTVAALTVPALEAVYDALATAIDAAGPQRCELLLVKLALLNANALGDAALFEQHLRAALQDL